MALVGGQGEGRDGDGVFADRKVIKNSFQKSALSKLEKKMYITPVILLA
jgi:hypothetical protein